MSAIEAAPGAERNLAVIQEFLSLLEQNAPPSMLERVLAPDIVAVEHPNRLLPEGIVRDRAEMIAGAARGQRVCPTQRYTVRTMLAVGERVAVEMEWEGVLGVPVGNLPAGAVMKAAFAAFYTIRDGQIVAVQNYDCFAPM